MNLITVTNPILFTEHLAVMGRVPMSKYYSTYFLPVLNFSDNFLSCV